MTFESTTVSNILLACIAIINLVTLTIVYETTRKQK
jgi:hypothetical protein